MNLVSRAEWGARPPRSVSTIPTPTPKLVLHHGATPGEGPDKVRSYQRYHMDVKGYVDVAYSWLADSNRVYEGRGVGVEGAHTGGHNRVAHAVCAVGDYSSTKPSDALLDNLAAAAVHAWRLGAVLEPRYTHGHRQLGTTSCPGDRLFQAIPEINRRAAALAEGDTMRKYAQCVVVPTVDFGGKNRDWDRALGAVIAATYEWAVVETDDGRTFTSLTHPGEPAQIGDWAGVVGAARYDVDRNPPGTRIAGEDRWDTAAVVAELLLDHPAEKIDRRGAPW